MRLLYVKDPENADAQKILATAALANVTLEVGSIEPNKRVNMDAGFREEYDPCGMYPVLQLEDGSGVNLFESNAIVRYIARFEKKDALHVYGRTPFESSQVDMWVDFATTEIDAANMPYIEAKFEKKGSAVPGSALTAVETVLAALEEVLSIRTFLVGERMSIADVAVAFSVQWVYRCNAKNGDSLAKKYRAVYRHYNTIMRNPKIRSVLVKEGATIGPLRS